MAYLVAMAIRINEIFRCLRDTGSFYLHCDQTASHYLKLICDSVFIPRGGKFLNDIVWCYSNIGVPPNHRYPNKHDNLLFYSKKEKENYFKQQKVIHHKSGQEALAPNWWIDIPSFNGFMKPQNDNHLGFETQKPRKLLERIIKSSSREGDVVMDCFCGCGTAIDMAHQLKRSWIGIDITYRSIALVLKRLKKHHNCKEDEVSITGIPRDLEGALALANKADDRVRKEFEKWAILTFTSNTGITNDKKGPDGGSDGVVYFMVGKSGDGVFETKKASFEVKSGVKQNITHSTIDRLCSGMDSVDADVGYLLTLNKPSKGVYKHAESKGKYNHPLFPGKAIRKVHIIAIEDVLTGKTIEDTGLTPVITANNGKILRDIDLGEQPDLI